MDADVGIIGLGTMGSMALWQLAKRGISTIGFEQFGIGHDRGAAGGDTRIFRTSYKEDPDYVPILLDAYKEWRQLEKETGKELLTLTKGLMIHEKNSKEMENVLKSIKDHQLEHKVLSKEEAEFKYPQHILNSNEAMIIDTQSGFIRSQLSILTAVERAKNLGAKVYSNSAVDKIVESTNGNGVNVFALGKKYTFKKVIITVGPWINEFFPTFKNNIDIHRLIGCWFPAKNIKMFKPENFPVFTRKNDNIGYYGIPSIDNLMVKISFGPQNSKINNTNELNKNVSVKDIEIGRQIVKNNFLDVYNEPSRINAYMEAYTKDEHPIIGEIPKKENLIIAGGFSGHGFKMAPTIGKILAELALEEIPSIDIKKFSPKRFLSHN